MPRFLHRDRDSIYGQMFKLKIAALGIEQVINVKKLPWQSPYIERVVGSIRRECTDHIIARVASFCDNSANVMRTDKPRLGVYMTKTIFDIGFYDGKDTDYYLKRGFEVIAFEANPLLCERGRKEFAEAISSGQLQLHNYGIGSESGSEVDFFLHNDSEEWSTFYREAAINWGPGKSTLIQVPCITAREMFAKFGTPFYVKVDIEGYDIIVADELQHLADKPVLASFEASNNRLLRSLLLAGYQSFKLVDQSRVSQQVAHDETTGEEFRFYGGTGPFGDDAEGDWLSFENMSYLWNRIVHDPFASATPPGHWFDVHASIAPAKLGEFEQRDQVMELVGERYGGHCGMQAGGNRPSCPAEKLSVEAPAAHETLAEVTRLRAELDTYQSSRAWKLASLYGRVVRPVKRIFHN